MSYGHPCKAHSMQIDKDKQFIMYIYTHHSLYWLFLANLAQARSSNGVAQKYLINPV